MNELWSFLSSPLFQIGDVSMTIVQLLMVPLLIAFVFLVTRWFVGVLARRMLARGYNANLVQMATRGIWVLTIIVLFIASLGLLNVPLTAFAFLSGAIAIGLGFGAQNIINNFISGLILIGEAPIRIDDLLEINGTLGRVEAINTRSTRIRRVDGVRIVIPNSHLLENIVVNWTLADQEIRTSVRVGVAYGSPVRKVAALIEQATREQADILEDPEPVILFEDFGDSALVFDSFFFTLLRPGGDLRRLRSEIRFRIEELFHENNIVIAFPQRDVHIDTSHPIDVRVYQDASI
ncbi:MAG: mechanosensitive ion channel [Gammaproteobacteria bacterium]|nr:mechanosensitive ion channel [Gammaproteobacteria bacterium]